MFTCVYDNQSIHVGRSECENLFTFTYCNGLNTEVFAVQLTQWHTDNNVSGGPEIKFFLISWSNKQ